MITAFKIIKEKKYELEKTLDRNNACRYSRSWAFTVLPATRKILKLQKTWKYITTLFRELNMFYVDEVNPNKLVKTSIDEMLNSLDPYTNYISEDQIEDFRFMTTGEYAGIGA